MPVAVASLPELETLLEVELRELQSLESTRAAAGTNSGIENELAVRRDKVAQLRDRIRNYVPPSDAPDDVLTLSDPAATESALAQIAERTRPSGRPANAFRVAATGVPRLSDGHTAVRTGSFGKPRPPKPVAEIAPVPVPSPVAAAPVAPPAVPLAGTHTIAGRVTITSDLNAGLVTAVIEPTAPPAPNPSP